jgi:hypothetical protein
MFHPLIEVRSIESGDPGKPPAGYKCRRCDSSDVGRVFYRPCFTYKKLFHKHFINDCPERTKPPEGYICKICNTVSDNFGVPFVAKSPAHLLNSLVISFAIVLQDTLLGIQVVASHLRDMCVALAEAMLITSPIAPSQIKSLPVIGRGNGHLQRKLHVSLNLCGLLS